MNPITLFEPTGITWWSILVGGLMLIIGGMIIEKFLKKFKDHQKTTLENIVEPEEFTRLSDIKSPSSFGLTISTWVGILERALYVISFIAGGYAWTWAGVWLAFRLGGRTRSMGTFIYEGKFKASFSKWEETAFKVFLLGTASSLLLAIICAAIIAKGKEIPGLFCKLF